MADALFRARAPGLSDPNPALPEGPGTMGIRVYSRNLIMG